jgi:hypothetical protein
MKTPESLFSIFNSTFDDDQFAVNGIVCLVHVLQ